jgi:hypothetical protein
MDSDEHITPARRSGRIAAQRASKAIKRTADSLESAADNVVTKRPRRGDAIDYAEDSKSETESSLSSVPSDFEKEVQESGMEGILSSMASTAKEGTKSAAETEITQTITIRPPSSGKPLVWAKARGSLCEALPYFKSHKSSLHSEKLVAKGFLIDSEVDPLDVFGGEVIITSM